MHYRYLLLADCAAQYINITMGTGRQVVQAGTAEQWPEQFPQRDIKRLGGFLQHHIARANRVLLLHPQQAIDNAVLHDPYPLGGSGRAGGVNQAQQIGGCRCRGIAGWRPVPVGVDVHKLPAGQAICQCCLAEQQAGTAVIQQLLAAGQWQFRFQQQPAVAAAVNRQQGD